MTRDYKHRTSRKGSGRKNGISFWRWSLAAGLLVLFSGFLMLLRSPEPQGPEPLQIARPKKPVPAKKSTDKAAKIVPEKPRFEFYTILPEQEIEIPETEIKIRKSEEKQGRVTPGRYSLQVGSFKKFQDADRLKAELAMQGIPSNIESAKIDALTWHRVKIGPLNSMTAVDAVRGKLRQQHVDAIVISSK